MRASVGVFDSGIGGLTVLRQLTALFPRENFLYVADGGYCPYGNKRTEEIESRVRKMTSYLVSRGVKAVVIACNTASVHLSAAREEASGIPVVGVIEPTCAEAIRRTKNKKVALLATSFTVQSGVYQRMLASSGVAVRALACGAFVDFVEHHDIGSVSGRALAEKTLSPLKKGDFDTVILGCTHFPLVEKDIRSVLGARQYLSCDVPAARALADILPPTAAGADGKREICTTGKASALRNLARFGYDFSQVTHIDV